MACSRDPAGRSVASGRGTPGEPRVEKNDRRTPSNSTALPGSAEKAFARASVPPVGRNSRSVGPDEGAPAGGRVRSDIEFVARRAILKPPAGQQAFRPCLA